MSVHVPDKPAAAQPDALQKIERPTPVWYRDAKLGIFIPWGL
jgi:hypothetical protein